MSFRITFTQGDQRRSITVYDAEIAEYFMEALGCYAAKEGLERPALEQETWKPVERKR